MGLFRVSAAALRRRLFARLATLAVPAFALALSLLGGCADRGDFADRMPVKIGDVRPASGVAKAPQMPIQGIDVSSHNGDIDWQAVKAAGIDFAYLKTTEGGDYADTTFFQNWKLAEAAGVHRGAYHFMYWCRAADQQALFFMVNVPNDPDALPPVLDLEWNDDSPSCPGAVSPGKAIPMIKTLLKAMEARTGKRPIIYTDLNFYRDILAAGAFKDYPFWLRSTAATPDRLYPGRSYTYWQFTGTGRVPGIRGDVDRNVFNGTADEWQTWLIRVGAAPPLRQASSGGTAATPGTVTKASAAVAQSGT
jgi:lysozyme